MSGLGSAPGEQGSSGEIWLRGLQVPVLPVLIGLPVLGLSALVGLPGRGEDVQTRAEGRGGMPGKRWRARSCGGAGWARSARAARGRARPFWGAGQASPARWRALVIQLFKLTNIIVIYALQWQ